jgi:hypothetical protein
MFTFQGPKKEVVQSPEVNLSKVQVRSDWSPIHVVAKMAVR